MELTGGLENASILAAPSMDLFLYLKYLQRICQSTTKGDRSKINRIVLELPYYIFNYDLSKTKETAYLRFSYFYYIDAYHHLKETERFEEYKEEFSGFARLFEKDAIRFNVASDKKNFMALRKLHGRYRIIVDHYSVWEKHYDETVKENIELFQNLITMIRREFDSAKVEVMVTPFHPLFRLTHKNIIAEKKKIFYGVMSKNHIPVIDHFELLNRVKYFSDHCHMNLLGANTYKSYLTNWKVLY